MSENSKLSRREVVLRLASTGLAAAAVGGGALAFHNRQGRTTAARAVPDWRMPGVSGLPPAVAVRGPDPAGNVRRAVEALGGMTRFVKPGEVVVIKPNVGWDRLPEQAANTDPHVVAELVRLCRGAGARKVIVTDNSCNDPRRCFARSGIGAAARESGAEVVDTTAAVWAPAALAGYSTGLEVMEHVLAADRVINVPVVKHHSLSRVTIGMKNWMGVVGRGRNRLHQSIHRAVAELGAMFRPTLTVIDATRVLMANGPTGGSLGDVRAVGAVAAGIDPVACDAWGAAQMDVDPATLPFLAEAEQRGLGRGDVRAVKELG
ncbi:MAG TPA: DUF362 domain-containing protein [Thermoanaerobaculaceae bacterium]|mgnify:CR=1 FL=1|nr:DUF362 domain-containing protein [Thermoanaerobaculaceae bacterium]HRS15312.1 DUF362 domain-containing protein [Thermoanaerobaculaceae bacterium]